MPTKLSPTVGGSRRLLLQSIGKLHSARSYLIPRFDLSTLVQQHFRMSIILPLCPLVITGHLKSFSALVGLSHVIYGALAVYLWSSSREMPCSKHTITWSTWQWSRLSVGRRSIRTSSNKSMPCRNEVEEIQLQSMSNASTHCDHLLTLSWRFFKRLKLDYPQPDTTRASRRFVKAMKRLEVR